MTRSLLVAIGLVFIVAGAGVLLSGVARYRELLKTLDRPWRTERLIYRHHRAFGGGIAVGAVILLAVLARHHGISFKPLSWPSSGAAQLMLLVRLAAWSFACLSLPIGIIIAIRPSVLKGIEVKANRWVQPSLPAVLEPGQFGTLLLVAGSACLLLAIALTSLR